MVAIRWVFGAVIAAVAVSADNSSDPEPGTNLYNCHDNCGNAILAVQAGGDVCDSKVFKTDYQVCLECAGSTNDDIWDYYGPELTSAAASCSLSTTPYTASMTASVPTALAASSAAAAGTTTTAASSASTAGATITATASSNSTNTATLPGKTVISTSGTASATGTSASASTVASSAASPAHKAGVLAAALGVLYAIAH